MLQLLQAFGGPGRVALSFAPTYSMYPEYARDTVTEWVVGHRESDFSLDLDHAHDLVKERQPSVVLLPSPNNPTGTALPLGGGRACSARRQPAMSRAAWSSSTRRTASSGAPASRARSSCCPEHRNLVVTRTMSKAFAAGRCCGSATSPPHPAICDAIRVVRLPYHLSAVTQAAALAALRHAPELLGKVDELRAERDATVDVAARPGPAGRRLRRQLRVVRDLRGPPCCLAGAARPGRADPGDRPRRVAAGVDRHRRRDDGVQAGTDRGEDKQ